MNKIKKGLAVCCLLAAVLMSGCGRNSGYEESIFEEEPTATVPASDSETIFIGEDQEAEEDTQNQEDMEAAIQESMGKFSFEETPQESCSVCHDEKIIPCPDCTDGTVLCPNCNGKGTYLCKSCEGTGYLQCGACKGEGGAVCASCQGTGIFGDEYTAFRSKCLFCNGTGYTECAYCKGQGKTVCFCGGSGTITCKECSGAGTKRCATCAGEAFIPCPNCSKEENGGQASDDSFRSDVYYVENPGISDSRSETICPYCSGTGQRLCGVCDGSGSVKELLDVPYYGGENLGDKWVLTDCPGCHGKGYTNCLRCGGDGKIY